MRSHFWDYQMETLPVVRLAVLQEHRLHWQVRRCWDASRWHRDRLVQAGIEPSSFRGRHDLQRLPILVDADLAATTLDGERDTLAVAPRRWWAHQQPDEAGRAARILTDADVVQQADIAARALWAAGARPGEPVTLEPADGAGAVAETAVRALERIAAQPWRAARMPPTPLRVVIDAAHGDAASVETQIRWSTGWASGDNRSSHHVALAVPYAAPTLAYTCGVGLHLVEDHFLIEIVHPTTCEPLVDGEAGAVIVSDLTREGSPLLRYWTGLLSARIGGECECGRTSARSPFVQPLA